MAAVIGAGIGGPPGALAGAAIEEGLQHLGRRAWQEIDDRAALRAGALVHRVADRAGVTAQILLERALTNPAQEALLREAMRAAVGAQDQIKVDALAGAVANGLAEDAAQIDQAILVVAALADLLPAHVRALAAVCNAGGSLPESEVAPAIGINQEMLGTITAALSRHGLVTVEVDFAGEFQSNLSSDATTKPEPTAWQSTPFGEACWRYLSDAAAGVG